MRRAVLFVDDSALARARVVRALGEHGFAVTALGSTREAEHLDPNAFAAALLDIELDDGFGPDLAERLRSAAPGLPIAFLTGGGPEQVIDQAKAIGPVFSKTSDVDEAFGWVVKSAKG
jgi:DNA-binding response OmpR family regulator